MMLFPTPVSPLPVQVLSDVSAFMVEITAAHVAALTNYHTFFVVASAGCKVFWGDGAESTLSAGTNTCTHIYAGAGQYLIRIKGAHTRFYHGASATASKVIQAVKLYSGVTSCASTFQSCGNVKFSISSGFIVHSNVLTLYAMLMYTTCNNDLSHWDTRHVTDMRQVFQFNTAFNRSLGSWNITSLLYADYMLSGTALSTANYSATLIGWAAQQVHTGVVLSAGSVKYSSAAAAARAVLTGTYGWTITDGGLAA